MKLRRLLFAATSVAALLSLALVGDAQRHRHPLLSGTGVLAAIDGADGDMFGEVVVLSGDGNTLAVSAPARDASASVHDAGAVYIYVRDGRAFRPEATLVSPAPAGGAQFGLEVVLSRDGNTVAIKNALHNPRVHLFHRENGAWSFDGEVAREVRRFDVTADASCVAASLEGNRVTVFRRDGPAWTTEWTLPNVDARQISLNSECTSVAFALSAATGVLVYSKGATGWAAGGLLRPSEPPLPASRGIGVLFARANDTLVIAAPRAARGTDSGGGGSYNIYRRTDAAGWTRTENVEFNEPSTPTQMDLATNGMRFVAGYGWAQPGVERNPVGAVRVFSAGDDSRFAPYLSERGGQFPARLGASVAMSDDGATMAVGAPNEGPSAGAALANGGPGAVHLYRVR